MVRCCVPTKKHYIISCLKEQFLHTKKESKWKQDGRSSSAVAQVPPKYWTQKLSNNDAVVACWSNCAAEMAKTKSFYAQQVSPGSDILFICVRMDPSPFLLVTANTLQGGCCFFFLFRSDRQKFPPLWLVKVFDVLLVGCCASSRPDIQSPCGHPFYVPFLCGPLVLSRKCLIYPHAILLSHFGFSH